MPRTRGKDRVRHVAPSSGRQLEQQDDAVARTRGRKLPEPKQAKQRQSELAKKAPYGDYRDRRKTS
jgi:hypothetical protein